MLKVGTRRIRGAATHSIKEGVVGEENANGSDQNRRHVRAECPTAATRGRAWSCRWGSTGCRAWSSPYEIELANSLVPIRTVCGEVFVHVPETHVINGIDAEVAVIAPAR